MDSPKIFVGSASTNLGKLISQKSKIPQGNVEIGKFADGEIDIWIKDKINNCTVFIIQSASYPINDHIIELTLILDAAKRSGAHKIIAVLPYFGYSRKEKQSRDGEPISAKVIADIITTSPINKVICLDLHADAVVGFFNVPVIHLSALKILAKAVEKERPKSLVVVSPDVGGVRRARNFATLINSPMAVVEKHRITHLRDTTEVLSMSGEIIGDTAIIVDDIISTGGTIISCAQTLKEKGVKKVFVCATHALFAADALKNLEKSVIDKIIVTDSLENQTNSSKIEVVSVANLFANCLKEEIQ